MTNSGSSSERSLKAIYPTSTKLAGVVNTQSHIIHVRKDKSTVPKGYQNNPNLRKLSLQTIEKRPAIKFPNRTPVSFKSIQVSMKNSKFSDKQQKGSLLRDHCKTTTIHNLNSSNDKKSQKTLPKIENVPKKTAKCLRCKRLNELINILLQLSNTNLAHSPYFGCLSKILNEQDWLAINKDKIKYDGERKREKKVPTGKFPIIENDGFPKRLNSAPSVRKINKEIQTKASHCPARFKKPSVFASKSPCSNKNLPVKDKISSSSLIKSLQPYSRNNAKVKKSANNSNHSLGYKKCATRLPLVASNKLPLKGESKSDLPETTESCKKVQNSTGAKRGNSLVNQQPSNSRYWRNEIKNYYDWTSFCLMRRYRHDTKKLKEQLQQHEQNEPSICDRIWKQAENFRTIIEMGRKNLNETLQPDKKSSVKPKKKPAAGRKPNSAGDVCRKPGEIQHSTYLVPPPSAPESLFLFRKEDSKFKLTLPSTTFVKSKTRRKPQTVDFSTLADDTQRSTSDDNIFAKYEREFKRNALQLRFPISDSLDQKQDTLIPLDTDQIKYKTKSKLKSKFTITNERLSFDHLKRT